MSMTATGLYPSVQKLQQRLVSDIEEWKNTASAVRLTISNYLYSPLPGKNPIPDFHDLKCVVKSVVLNQGGPREIGPISISNLSEKVNEIIKDTQSFMAEPSNHYKSVTMKIEFFKGDLLVKTIPYTSLYSMPED